MIKQSVPLGRADSYFAGPFGTHQELLRFLGEQAASVGAHRWNGMCAAAGIS
jgi:hypothetical protein